MQHLCIGVKPVHFIVIVVDRRGMWASLVWVGLARIHRYYIRCSPISFRVICRASVLHPMLPSISFRVICGRAAPMS